MNLAFPSREFDEAVAAVCHNTASDEQARALNMLLRTKGDARDEYIRRLEVHARLASMPDLFAGAATDDTQAAHARLDPVSRSAAPALQSSRYARHRKKVWAMAFAAGIALVTVVFWGSTGCAARLEAFDQDGKLVDQATVEVIPGRKAPADPIPTFELTVKGPAIAWIQFSGPRVGEYLAADELRFSPRAPTKPGASDRNGTGQRAMRCSPWTKWG
jgi:hypothetical protein